MDISIDITLIWGLINFFFVYLIFRYFLANKISNAIENRKKIIKDELDSAKKDREESSNLKDKIKVELAETEKNRKDILESAVKDAEEIKRDMTNNAKEIKDSIVEDGKRELGKLKKELEQGSKQEILKISTQLAEKLLQKSVDKKVEDSVFKEFKSKLKDNL